LKPDFEALQRAAVKDRPTVDAKGELLAPAMEGVLVRRLGGIHDDRGGLTPIIDPADPFWSEPVVHCYLIRIRPGRIKGWGLHERQADRDCVTTGSVRSVLFDARPHSPTRGEFAVFFFTPQTPGLLRIPPGVWHAHQNWGSDEALILNFPTARFDPQHPDKQRIDPHSGVIPFDWSLRDR
jgi:dTDP-4-dehydrorhamnose 3,5-epimerase